MAYLNKIQADAAWWLPRIHTVLTMWILSTHNDRGRQRTYKRPVMITKCMTISRFIAYSEYTKYAICIIFVTACHTWAMTGHIFRKHDRTLWNRRRNIPSDFYAPPIRPMLTCEIHRRIYRIHMNHRHRPREANHFLTGSTVWNANRRRRPLLVRYLAGKTYIEF